MANLRYGPCCPPLGQLIQQVAQRRLWRHLVHVQCYMGLVKTALALGQQRPEFLRTFGRLQQQRMRPYGLVTQLPISACQRQFEMHQRRFVQYLLEIASFDQRPIAQDDDPRWTSGQCLGEKAVL